MRPRFERLGTPAKMVSFTAYKVSVPFFEFYWHFHPEYELTLILNGKGNRLVGNSIEPFEKGDLVLLGANLPHVWVSDEKDAGTCEALVIQFPESFIQNLLHFPEWNCLANLVQHSRCGLAYAKIPKIELEYLTTHMKQVVDNHSLSSLIDLMVNLADKKGQLLSTEAFTVEKPSKDSTRLNAVLHFMQLHYLSPITLKDVAESIHLSKSALSKFFLRKMGKPFTTHLNELRIGQACRLLIETDKPISNVAHESGFENLSYFNREFLNQKNVTPTKFRKMME